MIVLNVQNLGLSFGKNTVFSSLSFDIKDDEKVGLIGVNGAGKTSLFKLITGEYTPDSGAVIISKNVKIGYMEQHTCSVTGRSIYDEIISVFNELIKAEKELEYLSGDEETRRLAELREKAIRDELAAIAQARDEGKSEGISKGISKVARKMLEKKMDIALIMEITGLTKAEIEKL